MSLLVREGLRGARGADPDREPTQKKEHPGQTRSCREKGPFRRDKTLKANFTFQQPARGHLVLDGAIDDHKIHMQLQLGNR